MYMIRFFVFALFSTGNGEAISCAHTGCGRIFHVTCVAHLLHDAAAHTLGGSGAGPGTWKCPIHRCACCGADENGCQLGEDVGGGSGGGGGSFDGKGAAGSRRLWQCTWCSVAFCMKHLPSQLSTAGRKARVADANQCLHCRSPSPRYVSTLNDKLLLCCRALIVRLLWTFIIIVSIGFCWFQDEPRRLCCMTDLSGLPLVKLMDVERSHAVGTSLFAVTDVYLSRVVACEKRNAFITRDGTSLCLFDAIAVPFSWPSSEKNGMINGTPAKACL